MKQFTSAIADQGEINREKKLPQRNSYSELC